MGVYIGQVSKDDGLRWGAKAESLGRRVAVVARVGVARGAD